MDKLYEILQVVSSVDFSVINGEYHVEVFEYSGKHTNLIDEDLDALIHMVHCIFVNEGD